MKKVSAQYFVEVQLGITYTFYVIVKALYDKITGCFNIRAYYFRDLCF